VRLPRQLQSCKGPAVEGQPLRCELNDSFALTNMPVLRSGHGRLCRTAHYAASRSSKLEGCS
jgi:hypothetical protein